MSIDKELFYDVISGFSDFGMKGNLDGNYNLVDKIKGIELQMTLEWENFCLDMSNDFALLVQSKYGEKAIDFWNASANDFHKTNYVSQLQFLIKLSDIPNASFEQISFDILHIIIYKHLQRDFSVNFGFYDDIYTIYKSGYIPVGYVGEYPNGKMLVMKL